MPDQPDQIATFINEVAPTPEAPKPNAPLVPFQSNLVLTGEQEKRMIDWAFKRLGEISEELGRNQTITPNWWQTMGMGAFNTLASQGMAAAETFFGKRSRYDATFLNDFTWRPYILGPDSIFQSSNFATPVTRRVCRQMIARAKNEFFMGDPWFSVEPAPVVEYDAIDDSARADKIQKFCRFKLKESGSAEDKGRAIARALVLGECVVKTSYVVRDQLFNTEARVLTGVDGQPVRALDGNFVTEGEEFVDEVDDFGTPKRVLKRDGVTEQPEAPIWQTIPLDRRQVLFEGARSEPIYYKDFVCPQTAEDVQTADCIAHLYDKPVMAFVDLLAKRDMIGTSPEHRIAASGKLATLVKKLAENTSAPKAAMTRDVRPNERGETPPSVESGGPVAEFVEFYVWFDANGDGVAENIMLICDRASRAPIFYEHVANMTTDGLRPFEVVRVNPVEGRWYGLGIMELFDSYQTQIDLLVNRWNFSQSRSGRVDLWTPTNTLEGDANPALKMNWGGTYTKKPGMKKEDVLESVYLTDIKFDQIHTQAQFFIQLLMNESGVSTANDDQAAGMQSAKLATGVIQTAQSGDELFRPIVNDLKGPLERILNREIEVVLANINPKEVFTYLEGDTQGIDHITAEEVRGLKFKTKITLSKNNTQQQVQIAAAITQLAKEFYNELLPIVQERLAPLYKKRIQALDPSIDVNTMIVPLALPPAGSVEPMPGEAPAPGGAPGKPAGKPGAGTPFSSQMGQKSSQMKGVSAPGGTPRAA